MPEVASERRPEAGPLSLSLRRIGSEGVFKCCTGYTASCDTQHQNMSTEVFVNHQGHEGKDVGAGPRAEFM